MSTQSPEAFTIALQRLYALEGTLVSTLKALTEAIEIDTLDDHQVTACRHQLRDRVATHHDETVAHREHLKDAIASIASKPETRPVPELDGARADAEQFDNVVLNDALRPLYFLGAAKKLEEIEWSAYEAALAMADRLEQDGAMTDVVDSLSANAAEERAMLADLDELSESESVHELLEASQVGPGDRTALDRNGINVETLDDLLSFHLRKLYDGERTVADQLGEMARTTADDALKDAFVEHAEQTRTHVDRLESVFEVLGPRSTANEYRTIDGVFASWTERRAVVDDAWTDLLDLETALTVERIEIRGYEDLLQLADRIGYPDAITDALQATLEEERETLASLEDVLEDRVETPPAEFVG